MGLKGGITAIVSIVIMMSAGGILFAQSGDASMRHSGMDGMKMDMASDTSKMASDTGKKMLSPQTTCPVMGGAINKNLYVDYKGKRIYVCCEGCIAEVKKDPEKYIKKLAEMGQGVEIVAVPKAATKKALAPQTTCPVLGTPIDKHLFVDYKGKRIYVCCSDCIAEVKKDPGKYIKKLEDMGQGVEVLADIPKTPAQKTDSKVKK